MAIVERLKDFKQGERLRSPRHERAKDGGDGRSKNGSPKAIDDEWSGDEGRCRRHKEEKNHKGSHKRGDSCDHKAHVGPRGGCFYCAGPHYRRDYPHKGKMIMFIEKQKGSMGDSSSSDGEARMGALLSSRDCRQNRTATMTEAVIRTKPGMTSVKDMPVLQDGPPPGGFAPVRYARRIPNKGPSAVAMFLATFGAFSWGMYQVGQGNKIRRGVLVLDARFCVTEICVNHDALLVCGGGGGIGVVEGGRDQQCVVWLGKGVVVGEGQGTWSKSLEDFMPNLVGGTQSRLPMPGSLVRLGAFAGYSNGNMEDRVANTRTRKKRLNISISFSDNFWLPAQPPPTLPTPYPLLVIIKLPMVVKMIRKRLGCKEEVDYRSAVLTAVLVLRVGMTVEAEIGLAVRIKSSGSIGYFGLCMYLLVGWKMLKVMAALDVQVESSQHIIAIPEEWRGKGWSKDVVKCLGGHNAFCLVSEGYSRHAFPVFEGDFAWQYDLWISRLSVRHVVVLLLSKASLSWKSTPRCIDGVYCACIEIAVTMGRQMEDEQEISSKRWVDIYTVRIWVKDMGSIPLKMLTKGREISQTKVILLLTEIFEDTEKFFNPDARWEDIGAIKEEKYAARVAILPLLQAEEDERFVVEWKKYLEEEARIMKDVPGWKVGENVYNSGRWMPPATGELRPDVW
ncbi:hypothetical protein RJ640_009953 [Escallonia rubra]|uniref:NADH dehydrogenase [ubiquinone] 1 alpha subcomplex subunit 13-B n=1 Tax=Escallonia rubra TaxID=112253 RepID=A0AA88QJS8_9ASTE|nr:hypothetical protein RJ640_009953 [Escallonia rubra]